MGLGKFITLEGGEGAGKSTLIAGLTEQFRARGLDLVVTREPGGTPLAEAVRALALNPPSGHEWSPLAHALLMNTAREDHLIRQIRPALARGHWVLCDRFCDSTRAYQSVSGVPMSTLKQLEVAVVGDTRPDLTLILDAPPEALAERRRLRAGASDVFERRDLDFHRQIREAFRRIAMEEPDRCVLVDALQEPEKIMQIAMETVHDRLGWP